MGGGNSKPSMASMRAVRGWKKGSFVELLMQKKYNQALAKLSSEANREVSIKFEDGEVRAVLPLHVACSIPDIPTSVLLRIIEAYPHALTHHTTLKRTSGSAVAGTPPRKEQGNVVSAVPKDISTASGSGLSASSSVVSNESVTSGVGWLPLHVACQYGASINTVRVLLEKAPGTIYCKTTEGLLPLHVACRRIEISEHLLETLVNAFPASIYVSTTDGATASDIAEVEMQEFNTDTIQLLKPTPATSAFSVRLERPLHNIRDHKQRSGFKKMVSTGRLNNKVFRDTQLFKALSERQWSTALACLDRKPKEAKVWTLSPNPTDPPCHMLPLHVAIRRKAPLDVIKAVLNANTIAIFRHEFMGMLPLHLACDNGLDVDTCQLLHDAYPNAARQVDLQGMLPLHIACSAYEVQNDVVTMLLGANADGMKVKDKRGQLAKSYLSPEASALRKEFHRGIDFWSAREIKKNPLSFLICQKRWDVALQRLKQNPEETRLWTIHPVIQLRYLPLHYACIVNAPVDLVNALLEADERVAATPCQEYGMLPLHLACQHNARAGVVKALIEANPDAATSKDAFDLLPLHLATTQGSPVPVIQALLEANPDAVAELDRNGHTPLVYAKAATHPNSRKVVKMMQATSS